MREYFVFCVSPFIIIILGEKEQSEKNKEWE